MYDIDTELELLLGVIDIREVKQSIRNGILERLQQATTPEEAFKVKLSLDVMDEFFLWIQHKSQPNMNQMD